MEQHTPTPWKAYQNALGIWSISTDSELIGQIGRHFNAEHIVKCVNSHDKLVEALKEQMALHYYLKEHYPDIEFPDTLRGGADSCGRMRQALAEAGS